MNQETLHDTIVVLDYGSQYSQLIARRLREVNVFSRLYEWNSDEAEVMAHPPKGFILSGGPRSVYEASAPRLPRYVLDSGLPILGICYGMQLLVFHLGGQVAPGRKREYGPAELETIHPDHPLFKEWRSGANLVDDTFPSGQVWMSHGDRVETLPDGFIAVAKTENSPYAAIADAERRYYCVQFHPEVAHTPGGKMILRNFAVDICGCRDDWTPSNVIAEQKRAIRLQVGQRKVLLGLSGGVDSAVVAALLKESIGDQLVCVFVDHGLLRKEEGAQVVETFSQEAGYNLVPVNAIEEFMESLVGVTDPELKRKIIGEQFIRVFEREARKLGRIDFLAQGTIYPDVIESAKASDSGAQAIKTHHNVGGLPEDLDFDLVEPIRMMFKDEVRKIGLQLGLPPTLVWRQPFPGPGLAIRCLGEVTWERLNRLREADTIFRDELGKAKLLQQGTQQSFAVLLPVRSVGVMGDKRTYEEVVVLRSITTDDFMTADWARLPHQLLSKVSNRIVNEVDGVNRVVFDITSKPPGTIEWE